MFPLTANEPYIKETGERSTLGAMIGSGGGGGGSELPEYDEHDSGKVLGVDEEGLLVWDTLPGGTKIYSKTYQIPLRSDRVIAQYANSEASASGIHINEFSTDYSANNVSIAGYTPISAIAIDMYTGYCLGVMLQQSGNAAQYGYSVTFALGNIAIDQNSCQVRVFYIKNSDLETLT